MAIAPIPNPRANSPKIMANCQSKPPNPAKSASLCSEDKWAKLRFRTNAQPAKKTARAKITSKTRNMRSATKSQICSKGILSPHLYQDADDQVDRDRQAQDQDSYRHDNTQDVIHAR